MSTERDVGVALSGGGHRATVFGLGALLALTDVGLHRRVVSVSSVSGGSIANGVVMTGPDYGESDPSALARHLAPRLSAVAERGILLGGAPATNRYLVSLIASGALGILAFVVGLVFLVLRWWLAGVIVLLVAVGALRVAWMLFGQRSVRTERAIDAELLGGSSVTMASLRDRPSSVHHVICTTELQTGTSFFFTNRAVYGHQFGGTTTPSDVHLATAVQASACVPGAFAPRVLSLRQLGLPGDGDIVVDDGGVYDNMADEWEYGFANRAAHLWDGLRDVQPHPARVLVVVNASGGWDALKPIASKGLRLELDGLLRAKDVQYDVSTAHRRRALAQEFLDDSPGSGLDDGVFVQITASPYRVPILFGPKPGRPADERSQRASEARLFLDGLGYSESWWDGTVKANAGVGTTLAKLSIDTTAKLLEHGYVLTLVNLYVILGLGSLPVDLDRERFRRLASGQAD